MLSFGSIEGWYELWPSWQSNGCANHMGWSRYKDEGSRSIHIENLPAGCRPNTATLGRIWSPLSIISAVTSLLWRTSSAIYGISYVNKATKPYQRFGPSAWLDEGGRWRLKYQSGRIQFRIIDSVITAKTSALMFEQNPGSPTQLTRSRKTPIIY